MLKRLAFSILTGIILATNVNAQFGPTIIRTPYGNVTVNTPSYPLFPIWAPHGMRMKKYDYTVLLKSGEVYKGRGKIQQYKGKSYIKFYSGKRFRLFNPADTKSISMVTSMGRKMIGIPSFNDSCWLFKVYEGKISKFAIIPEWASPYVSAIQKNKKKPPKQLSKENVLEMVKENPDALQKAKKGKLIDAIRIYNRVNN